ncbi:MAG TPA: FRG domain-containing protein [Bryobacteraceae bacterium]|nr:FRG domain-containing protein [Bryobacteraceae bacterium]
MADYISVISTTISSGDPFWFRGVCDAQWSLTPSALRYRTDSDCAKALGLVMDFKRVAEMKIDRPPQAHEQLKWAQLAQHYGLPTPLLDWTESATMALYFACENASVDGIVYLMNPVDLNRLTYPKRPRILDAHSDSDIVAKYLPPLDGSVRKPPKNPIAVNPVWNSSRLMAQKGVFTLHGKLKAIDARQAPSLVAALILKEYKNQLAMELERIGVDEMSIFPELDHACRFLKHKAALT